MTSVLDVQDGARIDEALRSGTHAYDSEEAAMKCRDPC
jgi:hypothetical protein